MGDQLAKKLETFCKNDSIIICLDKSSLLTCIELAALLHAYIFVMFYETLQDPYDPSRVLGAVLESGEFVIHPAISHSEYEFIYSEFASQIEEMKRAAMSRLNRSGQSNSIDRHFIDGRNVLLTDDILRDEMEIAIAKSILKPLRPAHIEGVAGNIVSEVSNKLYLETKGTTYLDVLASNIFDDNHYFEEPDKYSEDQKLELAKNISLYWV